MLLGGRKKWSSAVRRKRLSAIHGKGEKRWVEKLYGDNVVVAEPGETCKASA